MARTMLYASDYLTVTILAVIFVLTVTVINTSAQTTASTNTTGPSSQAGNTDATEYDNATQSEQLTDDSASGTTPSMASTTATLDSPTGTQPTQMPAGDNTATSGGQMNVSSTTPSGMTSQGADDETTSLLLRCYECETNPNNDSCLGMQDFNQPKQTCEKGERCWTTLLNRDGMFVNLTRGCLPDSCKDEHDTPSTIFCEQMRDTEVCTQCCQDDGCNSEDHEPQNTAGKSTSGCLSGVLLSVVAVVGLTNPY